MMLLVFVTCALVVVANTLIHYETLRALNVWLPHSQMPDRFKIVAVILGTFLAHALEIVLYGLTLYGLMAYENAGMVSEPNPLTLDTCLYFSAQAYTTLGFGDVLLHGPVRLYAGVEALQGLLMIGWSTSFAYLTMERFWRRGRT